jgi:type I restriction enzyme S subunit
MKTNKKQKNNWQKIQVGKLLDYEQPTGYIVDSTDYEDRFKTPVLTAGKTFILGYTNEEKSIFPKEKLPVIIFDDFTTANKFVDFPFKVKSSAMKILKNKDDNISNISFIFKAMQVLKFNIGEHKRNYLSEYQYLDIDLPDISEQNRIVSVLETWDSGIEKLKQKIVIKKEIKKGLMQELLTGKKRLPGFSREWQDVRLGDFCDFKKGKGLLKSQIIDDGKYECIHYGELFTKYREKITKILSKTDFIEKAVTSKVGDILFPTSDVTPTGLSTASTINKEGIVLGGDILIIRQIERRLNGLFFSYWVSSHKREIIRLVSGTTVFHLYGSDLSKLRIRIPNIKEQDQISQILTATDQEISTLEKKLTYFQAQKKYLLNNLVTGQIRTPENLNV